MKIEIELIEGAQSDAWNAGWRVTYEDKHTGSLAYDEMLGLVASIVFGLGEVAEPKSQIEKLNLIIKNEC